MLNGVGLCCVECYGALDERLRCRQCGSQFDRAATGAPILLTPDDRKRFQHLLNRDEGTRMQAEYASRRERNWIRKLYPPQPIYVNPSAPPIPPPRPGVHVWIGGAGLQLTSFINLDVAPVPGVDVVANASRLPFPSSFSDSVACLALLEHVIDPEKVIAEIHRVLKPDGETQVVVPFCHPYHAYPADYSRFSRERLTELFSAFRHVEIGIRTGPTTTMLTFLTYYLKIFMPVHGGNPIRRNVNRLVVGGLGWIMSPLRYLDAWLNRLPNADTLANHFYVVAKK